MFWSPSGAPISMGAVDEDEEVAAEVDEDGAEDEDVAVFVDVEF